MSGDISLNFPFFVFIQVLAMLGEQFMVGPEVCGAVVSIRYQVRWQLNVHISQRGLIHFFSSCSIFHAQRTQLKHYGVAVVHGLLAKILYMQRFVPRLYKKMVRECQRKQVLLNLVKLTSFILLRKGGTGMIQIVNQYVQEEPRFTYIRPT